MQMWKAVHVYYYDDDKEALLLDAIRPALQRLREVAEIPRVYLRRHWKFGPHVQLIMEAEEPIFADKILPLLQEEIGAYLRRHPSTAQLDPAAYAALSAKTGVKELEPGPFEPLQPDNTVCAMPYIRRVDLMKDERLMDAAETFRSRSLDLVFSLLERTRGQEGARMELLVQMMFLIAYQLPFGGLERGYISYVSHSQAYLQSLGAQAPAARKLFAEQDEVVQERMDELLNGVMRQVDEQGLYAGEDALLAEWSRLLQELYQDVYRVYRSGEVANGSQHIKQIASELVGETAELYSRDQEMSEFHRQLYSREASKHLEQEPEFEAYWALLNQYYFLLPMFGVKPSRKFLLCHLVAQSVQRVCGVTWQEVFNENDRRLQEGGPIFPVPRGGGTE
jgi:hypothetical protein